MRMSGFPKKKENDDVRVVGICGLPGVGKTALAQVLYGRIHHLFDFHCFIDDVNKIYQEFGSKCLQERFLSQVLKEENLRISNVFEGNHQVKSRLINKRALIVLDNVDDTSTLEKLALHRGSLGSGSRVIITSRNEHILNVYGVDKVHMVELLSIDEARLLFCRKAFKCDYIKIGYDGLTFEALEYCGELPLAIEVLSSFLFGKSQDEWRSALNRLKDYPNNDIMKVLRLSFDGLEEPDKEIFLDIACLFNSNAYSMDLLIKFLNYRGFHHVIGIKTLASKSLINIYPHGVRMHNLLEMLGKDIVRSEGKRQWSRLWHLKDLKEIVREDMEKQVEAIVVGSGRTTPGWEILLVNALPKMSRLKLFSVIMDFKVDPDAIGSLNHLSNELAFLEWYHYPFTYLPSSFYASELVELNLRYSKITQLWEDDKDLPNLKILILDSCQHLIKLPNFGRIPKLERLELPGCESLVEIDPSIRYLKKLKNLDLQECRGLKSIPTTIWSLTSLEILNIFACRRVFASDMDSHSSSAHQISPVSLAYLIGLRKIDLSYCDLWQIPAEVIGSLRCLERLSLRGNKFDTLPTLKELSRLVYLDLSFCYNLKSLPDLPSPTTYERTQDHHPLGPPEAGLYIRGCSKLGDLEHCSSKYDTKLVQQSEYG